MALLECLSLRNVKQRFLASEWNVLEVKDGNDIEAIDKAIIEAFLKNPKKSQP